MVQSLQIMPNGEGVTMTTQTFLTGWIVNSAGYLGTTVFGAVMLQRPRPFTPQSVRRAALFPDGLSRVLKHALPP